MRNLTGPKLLRSDTPRLKVGRLQMGSFNIERRDRWRPFRRRAMGRDLCRDQTRRQAMRACANHGWCKSGIGCEFADQRLVFHTPDIQITCEVASDDALAVVAEYDPPRNILEAFELGELAAVRLP